MIGKLIKYEFRSLWRRFLPLWAGLAALGLVNGFTITHVLENNRIEGLSNFLLGVLPLIILSVLFTVLGVLTLVFICQRFYQGLLGREGYLMFTLPVSSAEHILAKTIAALLLTVLTGLAFLLSGTLLVLALDVKGFLEGVRDAFAALRQLELPRGIGWLITEGLVCGLVTAASSLLQIYAAIALGHLASRHRAGWSLLAYVGISMILSTGVFQLGSLGMGRAMERWLDRILDGGVNGAMSAMAAGMGFMILINLALAVVFFFLTKIILDKKLNLE